MKSKVHYMVAAILSGVSCGALAGQSASNKDSTNASGSSPALVARANGAETADMSSAAKTLNEIVVTATRRKENIQDVPIAMQALNGRMLRRLHITSFEDLVQMAPNLTSADTGPGENEIFIRGAGAGTLITALSGTEGPWPNVAVYLDNQSVQFPGQNMDIYMVDMNRIEVLEGPQGTLFGSGAEAGAIRYITNKPRLDVVEGNFSGDYGVTAHGGPNTAVSGVLNLPIIKRHMAVRLVAYSERQGGYINNVPGTFARHDTDVGIHYANFPAVNGQCPDGGVNSGFCVPPGSAVVNNNLVARNDFNPVTYDGGRVEALYKVNDDWSLLVTQLYQNLDAQGVFFQYPTGTNGQKLNPLEVQTFAPTFHEDKDSNTAWTLKGKAGALSLIYTGGLLTRNIQSQTDYTNYARGVYADYYQCFGPGRGGDNNLTSTCFSPVTATPSDQQNRHWQHEFRVETPNSWRLRGIVGAYDEDNIIYDQTDEGYRSIPACTSNGPAGSLGNSGCLTNDGTFPGSTVRFPGVQSSSTAFAVNTKREERQIAEFASVSFDLTPHLILTAGARHFVFFNSLAGSVLSGYGCFELGTPPGGCQIGTNLNKQNLRNTESGWRYQSNISWHVDPTLFGNRQHIMTYFTFSQGFRPGGFNRNGGTLHGTGPDGLPQFVIPKSYQPDTLNNYEVGWKTDWRLLHRDFQWNTAFYRENWNNVQITFFNPDVFGNLFFDTNGQNFRIDGVETSFVAQLWRGLTVQGMGAWNSSEQTNSPQVFDNNPASANFGKPITESCPSGSTSCTPVGNLFGPRGAPTSNSPPIRYTVTFRYDFPITASADFGYLNDAVAHIQIGLMHQGHSFTQAGSSPPLVTGIPIVNSKMRFEDPAYTTCEASIGIAKGDWELTAYGQNLTNSNAAVFTSTYSYIVQQTPLRPRVLGLRFNYSF